MIRISTHVLDTAVGKPARDMAVRLEHRENSGEWRVVSSGRTDQEGRCHQLARDEKAIPPGTYRLAFDTADYYAAQNVCGLYPIVQITFSLQERETHLHIPLLLSPHGYTTYRGS